MRKHILILLIAAELAVVAVCGDVVLIGTNHFQTCETAARSCGTSSFINVAGDIGLIMSFVIVATAMVFAGFMLFGKKKK